MARAYEVPLHDVRPAQRAGVVVDNAGVYYATIAPSRAEAARHFNAALGRDAVSSLHLREYGYDYDPPAEFTDYPAGTVFAQAEGGRGNSYVPVPASDD